MNGDYEPGSSFGHPPDAPFGDDDDEGHGDGWPFAVVALIMIAFLVAGVIWWKSGGGRFW